MDALLITMLCIATQIESEYPRSHFQLPVHGTVHKETLHGFFGKTNSDTTLDAMAIDKPPTDRLKTYGVHYGLDGGPLLNYRHQIRFDSIWIATSCRSVCRLKFDELHFFDSTNKSLIDQFLKNYPNATATLAPHRLVMPALWKKYDKFERFREGNPPDVLGYGSVPITEDTCKCYMLTKPNQKLELWDTHSRWDDKKQIWVTVKDEQNLEVIDSPFAEQFYFFVRKDDYYFVTQSGELYIAPPPKKGQKSRSMTAIWDDKTRPIVGIIEDADKDKVWLFAETKKGDPKRAYYFEMNSKTRYEEFDPAKLAKVDIDNPRARQLLEYIPLIRPDLAAKKKGP